MFKQEQCLVSEHKECLVSEQALCLVLEQEQCKNNAVLINKEHWAVLEKGQCPVLEHEQRLGVGQCLFLGLSIIESHQRPHSLSSQSNRLNYSSGFRLILCSAYYT